VSVGALYEGWRRVQGRLVERLPQLSDEELALRSKQRDSWPVWALIAHVAGARVYWLCSVCGEPGVETTPFPDPANDGWEDHLERPRGSAELLSAIESSGAIVDRCLDEWTIEMLSVAFTRVRNGELQQHTRASVLTRILTHDAFHVGEVSLLLGSLGSASLDPWEFPPPPA
jgi:uncharacterized damage-inducible protein DinB